MNRFYFEEIIAKIFGHKDFMFFGHILAQCVITMDKTLPAPAGVYFHLYSYHLDINPILFNKFSEQEKIAILIHEACHIVYNHVTIRKQDDHERWNYATDIAINQMIENIPASGLHYNNYNLPENLSSEQYYILLEKNDEYKKMKEKEKKNREKLQDLIKKAFEDGKLDSDNTSTDGSEIDIDFPVPMDAHDWKESVGDEDFRKELTKNMLDKAISKSRGNTPSGLSDMLNLFKSKNVVDWRRELRKIVGNKKCNVRRTIMRSDRRFPNREDLRGKTKDVSFDLVVILDVSGSMRNGYIIKGLTEIKEICRLTNTSYKIVQVDTQVHGVDDFDTKTKRFTRLASGGTRIYPAVKYIDENKIPYNAMIVITDMGIESIQDWKTIPKVPMLFLDTQGGNSVWDGFMHKNFKYFDISKH
jgi:predicted metal-dependent peptidase